MEPIDRQVKFQRVWDMVASFKRDIRAKEAVNLDGDILPHEKNGKWRNNGLIKKYQLHVFQAFAIRKGWILFVYIIGRQRSCQVIAAKCMKSIDK